MEVCIYWNKKLLDSERGEFDRKDLFPNKFSECASIIEQRLEQDVKERIEIGYNDNDWIELSGTMDLIIAVNGYEVIRTGTFTQMPYKYVSRLMGTISLACLKSFEDLTNDRELSKGVVVIPKGLQTEKFDKDKAFQNNLRFKN